MLTQEETVQLLTLLKKAAPRSEVAGRYNLIVTPTTYAPEDFIPYKKVCIDTVDNVIGKATVEIAQ
jgi:hypothetical protein